MEGVEPLEKAIFILEINDRNLQALFNLSKIKSHEEIEVKQSEIFWQLLNKLLH